MSSASIPADSNPYAGSTTAPPGAGQRSETGRTPSEFLPSGLLARGTRITVDYPLGSTRIGLIGELADFASVPAPYISVDQDSGGRVVVFLGPGVTITHAPPEHPALG